MATEAEFIWLSNPFGLSFSELSDAVGINEGVEILDHGSVDAVNGAAVVNVGCLKLALVEERGVAVEIPVKH